MDGALRDFLIKKSRPAEKYEQMINQMLNDDRYQFAWDTLMDMYESVHDSGRISEKLAAAIDHIYQSIN